MVVDVLLAQCQKIHQQPLIQHEISTKYHVPSFFCCHYNGASILNGIENGGSKRSISSEQKSLGTLSSDKCIGIFA